MTHDAARALTTRHFSGEMLTGLEQQALRAHVRGCPPCRAFYDAAAETETLLGPHATAERLAREAPHWRPARVFRGPRRSVLLGATGALAAAGLAVWVLRPAEDAPGEGPAVGSYVGVRGGEVSDAAFVSLFSRRGATEPTPLGESIAADDELLLAYTNGRASSLRYLAVAGRDAAGRVHWLWPAWDTPETDVKSLPVEVGVADAPLPSAVSLRPAAGPLEICAIFSREALSVPTLDVGLERGERWPSSSESQHVVCRTVTVR
jgi:hypothetical protein